MCTFFLVVVDQNGVYLQLLEPDKWPANSPDLNPVDLTVWGVLQEKVYRGRKFADIESLKAAISEEWAKFPQAVINSAIDAFKKRLKLVIENGGGHIECYKA